MVSQTEQTLQTLWYRGYKRGAAFMLPLFLLNCKTGQGCGRRDSQLRPSALLWFFTCPINSCLKVFYLFHLSNLYPFCSSFARNASAKLRIFSISSGWYIFLGPYKVLELDPPIFSSSPKSLDPFLYSKHN